MDTSVPYMPAVGNLPKILQAIQRAGVPEVFTVDFLKDLGFKSSNDRAIIRVLKYLGFLSQSGHPTDYYRQFMNETQAKTVLAERLREAFDDLFKSDKDAHTKSATDLKGWFKTKTGVGDAAASKMASQFRALAQLADFSSPPPIPVEPDRPALQQDDSPATEERVSSLNVEPLDSSLSLVYRLEIHLPDTHDVDTYRAIFKALREELTG